MFKFNIGDMVTGIPNTGKTGYSYTNEYAIMEVIRRIRGGGMRVKIINHMVSDICVGREYDVNESQFILLENKQVPKTEDTLSKWC